MKVLIKRFVNFVTRIIDGFVQHELFAFAGDMTYKLILSIFPLIMFVFSFIGFLQIDNLDGAAFLDNVQGALPPQIMEIIDNFVFEVIDKKNPAVLSTSLVVTLYSASSGFASIIKGINRSYGQRDTRGWLRRRVLSIILVLLFVVILALTMGFMVFSRSIRELLGRYLALTPFMTLLLGLIGYLTSVLIILAIIIMIYKLGNCKKVKIRDVFPGACVTVLSWILFSKLYNVYIANFARYTVIYGSIGSIFILLIWLNCITAFLLIGSEVNALLSQGYAGSELKRVL